MPIEITCQKCGRTVRAKDEMAGKRAKCPGCGDILQIPEAEIYDAADDYGDPVGDEYGDDYGDAYATTEMGDAAEYEEYSSQGAAVPTDNRKPCPMCGEMIKANAAKCRYCGEVFDPKLKKHAKKGRSGTASVDEDMTTGDWVVAVLCSGIGCIAGIVWMIQGKPKGPKMLGVSLGFVVMWNIIRFVFELIARGGV